MTVSLRLAARAAVESFWTKRYIGSVPAPYPRQSQSFQIQSDALEALLRGQINNTGDRLLLELRVLQILAQLQGRVTGIDHQVGEVPPAAAFCTIDSGVTSPAASGHQKSLPVVVNWPSLSIRAQPKATASKLGISETSL